MFAPGLGDDFELDVGRVLPETVLRAVLRLAEVVLDRLHLVERQRENALAADLHKLVVGDFEIVLAHLHVVDGGHKRQIHRNPVGDLFAGEHPDGLDQLIRQQLRRDRPGLLPREFAAVEQIFCRTEDGLVLAELPAEDIADGGLGRAADIVSHARTETDRNQIFALRKLLEILGFRSRNPPPLKHRIVKKFRNFLRFLFRNIGRNRVDIAGPDLLHREAEEFLDLLLHALPAGVAPLRQRRNFNPVIHCKPGLSISCIVMGVIYTRTRPDTNSFRHFFGIPPPGGRTAVKCIGTMCVKRLKIRIFRGILHKFFCISTSYTHTEESPCRSHSMKKTGCSS